MEILMKKNEELEATLKETEDQRRMRQEIDELQEEVDKRDEDIKTLQKQLKEAEYILVIMSRVGGEGGGGGGTWIMIWWGPVADNLNPNPIGLFWGLESMGGPGGAVLPPPPLRSQQIMDRLTRKLAQS